MSSCGKRTQPLANNSILSKHNDDLQYEKKVVHSLCYARSFETETVLILSNAGGPDEQYYMGGSGVWLPLKGNTAALGYDEELSVVDVDTEVLKVSLDPRTCTETRTRGRSTRSARTGGTSTVLNNVSVGPMYAIKYHSRIGSH